MIWQSLVRYTFTHPTGTWIHLLADENRNTGTIDTNWKQIVMTQKLSITTPDLDLIQEAIGYMSKRFFSPSDSILLNEIEERLDDCRRELSNRSDSRLILSNSHYGVFQRVLLSYADELNHPSSDSSNRLRIKRLKTLARNVRTGSNLLGRVRSWLMGQ